MGSLEQYGTGALAGGLPRRAGRAVTQVRGVTSVALAQVEAKAEIQAAKVDAVSLVTQRALQGVAFVSQVEQQLAQAVPLAASRLQAIGDIGALGLSQIVMDTANDLRRI